MPAALEHLADFADVERRVLRAGADPDFLLWKLLEKDRGADAIDRAEIVDDPLVVLRDDAELGNVRERERECGDPVAAMELGLVEGEPEEIEPALRLALIHRAGERRHVHPCSHES